MDTVEERVREMLMSDRWSEGNQPCEDRRVFISGGQRGWNEYRLIIKQTAVHLISLNPAGCRTNDRDAWQRITT